MTVGLGVVFFFFFNDTATTEIYSLSLHDALPISSAASPEEWQGHHHLRRAPRRSRPAHPAVHRRSEEHTSELQSQSNLVCRLLLEKKQPGNERFHSTNSYIRC